MFFLFAFNHVGKFRLITCFSQSKFQTMSCIDFQFLEKKVIIYDKKMALPLALVLTQFNGYPYMFIYIRPSYRGIPKLNHFFAKVNNRAKGRAIFVVHISGKQQNQLCFVLGQT